MPVGACLRRIHHLSSLRDRSVRQGIMHDVVLLGLRPNEVPADIAVVRTPLVKQPR